MNRRQKLLNWLLTLSVFAWTVWQAATTFQPSYLRIGEAFRDFGLSIKFFFCLLLGIPNYTMPTVNNFSDVMPWRLIPEEWAAFWARVKDYSIRTDNRFLDAGNFPMWSFDFFRFDYGKNSRYAHILDFDVLRLGKKVVENNPKAGSFEFGVVAITEVGKERGNNLELKEVKKGQDETNQKNDLFNAWLKMCRHSATVDHFPFIKVFTDEQRPESWGADARDLCDIVHIVSSGEQRLALPFFTIEEMVQEWLFGRFMALYYDFRHRRGDNTLLVHVLKSITATIYKHYVTTYNCYGYSITKIEKERGTQDGNVEKKKYFLMNQKIYANRFSTDCFSDYFNDMARKSKMGLHDYVTYQTEKATVEELKMQNSYFINGLYKR